MPNNKNHSLLLLEKLKLTFLGEMEERCNDMENIALTLLSENNTQYYYDDLYGKVHSLKGSAGTNGITIISTICHSFEDLLNTYFDEYNSDNFCYIDVFLEYVDLIKEAAVEASNKNPDYSSIVIKIDKIREKTIRNRLMVLIVESSPLMVSLYKEATSSIQAKIIVANTGLKGLERLMNERFDLLITGNILNELNGIAMVSALRLSNTVNSNIQVIMISSENKDRVNGGTNVDHIIMKSENMLDKLISIIKSIPNTEFLIEKVKNVTKL